MEFHMALLHIITSSVPSRSHIAFVVSLMLPHFHLPACVSLWLPGALTVPLNAMCFHVSLDLLVLIMPHKMPPTLLLAHQTQASFKIQSNSSVYKQHQQSQVVQLLSLLCLFTIHAAYIIYFITVWRGCKISHQASPWQKSRLRFYSSSKPSVMSETLKVSNKLHFDY